MKRGLTLFLLAGLCVTVGATDRPKPTAAQLSQQFQRNRQLLTSLNDSTVVISSSSENYVKRSEAYYEVIKDFNSALRNAAIDNEPTRMRDLGRHLKTVISEGFTPTFRQAWEQVGERGTDMQKLKLVRQDTQFMIRVLEENAAKHAEKHPELRSLVEELQATDSEIERIVTPPSRPK